LEYRSLQDLLLVLALHSCSSISARLCSINGQTDLVLMKMISQINMLKNDQHNRVAIAQHVVAALNNYRGDIPD
jgi:hypothetical protein